MKKVISKRYSSNSTIANYRKLYKKPSLLALQLKNEVKKTCRIYTQGMKEGIKTNEQMLQDQRDWCGSTSEADRNHQKQVFLYLNLACGV